MSYIKAKKENRKRQSENTKYGENSSEKGGCRVINMIPGMYYEKVYAKTTCNHL